MDVLNKLKSTVTSTVSQLSGVLPGNAVTREFEATRHIASAGPGLLWKIYAGYKKSTRQEAAIFVLEKKLLERYPKKDREIILDVLRKGVSQLTRLRHPKILTVQHPLEESRDSLAFATEPVFASLANALGFHDNMPSPLPSDIKDFQLYEVEIKYGILQLCDGLVFLHNDVKLLHRNICPESIIINKSGAWKIYGFEFCVSNTNAADQPPFWPCIEWNFDIHQHSQPPLSYLAPEYALTITCSSASDLYSLGSLIYAIFNKGKTLFGECNTFSTFKKNCSELKSLTTVQLNSVPAEVREHVRLLLHVTPELRPDAHQFSKIPFFEDVGAKTLEYLDSLFQWNNLQKSQFYKGLPQVINQLPKRVNIYRVIPCLSKEFVNSEMIPFVLPSVLLIAENSTKEEFVVNILPDLKPIFKVQEPIQILLIFMQKMELLLTLTPPNDIKSHILPMIYRALEADAHQIQVLCLNILPSYANLIDYPSMKNALLPRIKKMCISTQYISVRVNCLVCLGKLLEHLDKWLVLDEVLPLMPEIPSREPAVLMGILGIYKIAMTHKKLGITKDVMANKVLPFLLPLSIENGLNLTQFNAVMAVVKDMVNRVEVEHRVKLEQLNSLQKEQRSALEMTNVQAAGKEVLIQGFSSKPATEMEQMFDSLGLSNFVQQRDAVQTASELFPNENKNKSDIINSDNRAKKTVPGSMDSLSLEDKERIARQQDQQQLMKSQVPLQPMSKTTTTTTTSPFSANAKLNLNDKPKDLTNTLINANLVNMSLAKPSSTMPAANPWATPSNVNSLNFQQNIPNPINPPPPVAMNWSANMSGMQTVKAPVAIPPPLGHMMGNNTPYMTNTGPIRGPTPIQGQKKMDTSALDNLFSSSQAKPSLNQLAGAKNQMSANSALPLYNTMSPIIPQQAAISPYGNNQNSNSRTISKLTDNDLSDLLS